MDQHLILLLPFMVIVTVKVKIIIKKRQGTGRSARCGPAYPGWKDVTRAVVTHNPMGVG